jgi:23S rRNA pseudouridine1911/1915/1917 synthase
VTQQNAYSRAWWRTPLTQRGQLKKKYLNRIRRFSPFLSRTQVLRIPLLFEDNHILAVNKPAGLLTMGDRSGATTLVDLVKAYLKDKYRKPGDVFLGVVHRLDRPVSGVVLFARTSKAAARLSAQFRKQSVQKTYLAWVEGYVAPPSGTLIHWLKKDRSVNRVRVVRPHSAGAQECLLDFRRVKPLRSRTLLEITPRTGRSHQIRAQLSANGWPIVGDSKYGSKSSWPEGIALHARSITFEHPTKHEPITIEAPLPEAWETSIY